MNYEAFKAAQAEYLSRIPDGKMPRFSLGRVFDVNVSPGDYLGTLASFIGLTITDIRNGSPYIGAFEKLSNDHEGLKGIAFAGVTYFGLFGAMRFGKELIRYLIEKKALNANMKAFIASEYGIR